MISDLTTLAGGHLFSNALFVHLTQDGTAAYHRVAEEWKNGGGARIVVTPPNFPDRSFHQL